MNRRRTRIHETPDRETLESDRLPEVGDVMERIAREHEDVRYALGPHPCPQRSGHRWRDIDGNDLATPRRNRRGEDTRSGSHVQDHRVRVQSLVDEDVNVVGGVVARLAFVHRDIRGIEMLGSGVRAFVQEAPRQFPRSAWARLHGWHPAAASLHAALRSEVASR